MNSMSTIKQNKSTKRNVVLLTMLLLFCMVLSSGCTFELPTPESLITTPESNQEQLKQKQIIANFLESKESLIVPGGIGAGTAYQLMNLDKDKEEELVAFYANKESDFVLGFMILDLRDGQWHMNHKVVAYGTGIDYFRIQDLDGDGYQEFLLGVRTGYGSMKELYLYHLEDNKLVHITDDDRIAYDRILLAEQENGETILITASTDTTVMVGSSNIIVYQYKNQNVGLIYEDTFEGYCSEMHFAKVNANTEGIYLAMRYNHYVNMLLLSKTPTGFYIVLEHSMPYDYEEMKNIALFGDVDEDGILEINSLWEPENNWSNRPYRDFVHVWLQWDGRDGLNAIDAIMEHSADGYQFRIPIAWMNYLYYDFYTENDIAWTEFYCYEEEKRSFETAFAIAAVDQLTWNNISDSVADTVVVLGNNPTLNKVYIADLQMQEINGEELNTGRLISCLRIEGGEQT